MMKLKKFEQVLFLLTVLAVATSVAIGLALHYVCTAVLELGVVSTTIVVVTGWTISVVILAIRLSHAAMRPINSMYLALEHLSINPSEQAPPDPNAHGISREIVEAVLKDVYLLSAGQHEAQEKVQDAKEFAETIINMQSSAIITLDRNRIITSFNKTARDIMPPSVEKPTGMTLEDVFEPEFSSGVAFQDWFSETQASKIQDRRVWEKVRILSGEENVRYYDLIADYNKNESHGIETLVVLVDKTATYNRDDDEVGFVSLAVHELRSPISLLRGYIEVFEEELGPTMDAEQKQFMNKMSVSAGQLSTFVNNILNVARVENDQLKLHLTQDDIGDMLKSSVGDFGLRAQVRGRKLTYKIGEGLTPVGLDRVGIYEVLSNLIDNAIKYSGESGEIIVEAKNIDNGVQVSIQDFGVGIPGSSLDNLFERFYRSHHSRDKVSGTGLGLFLSKKIVEAHSGTIWVKSVEGQGSTFGFDLPPFSTLEQDAEHDENGEIVRSAHGWIKNHGRLRR